MTPAGGSFFYFLRITNNNSTTCTTGGFFGVAVLSAGGSQVYQAVRAAGAFRSISLQEGQSATALLHGGEHREPGGQDCPSFTHLLVTPPDTTTSVRVTANIEACAAPSIDALAKGDGSG